MSDQDGGSSHPPVENQESAYPPPPGEEEDDRARPAYHHLPPPTSVTLPPIQDAPPAYGASRYPPPPDSGSRGAYSASPTLVPNTYPPPSASPNGYPPPGGSNGYPPPPGGMYNLPPVQAPDQRHYGVEPREYYPRGGSFAPPPPDSFNFAPFRPVSGPPFGAYPPDYGRGVGAPPPPQAPPRQRTSIACRYCRKRKLFLEVCLLGRLFLARLDNRCRKEQAQEDSLEGLHHLPQVALNSLIPKKITRYRLPLRRTIRHPKKTEHQFHNVEDTRRTTRRVCPLLTCTATRMLVGALLRLLRRPTPRPLSMSFHYLTALEVLAETARTRLSQLVSKVVDPAVS